jgi:hypothetical protein
MGLPTAPPLGAGKLATMRTACAKSNAARALSIDRIAQACNASDDATKRDHKDVLVDRHRLHDLGELPRARITRTGGRGRLGYDGPALEPRMSAWPPRLTTPSTPRRSPSSWAPLVNAMLLATARQWDWRLSKFHGATFELGAVDLGAGARLGPLGPARLRAGRAQATSRSSVLLSGNGRRRWAVATQETNRISTYSATGADYRRRRTRREEAGRIARA